MNSTPIPARDAEAADERAAIMAEGMAADELAIEYSWGRDASDAYPKQRTAASFRAFAKYVCDHRAKQKGQLYFCAPFVEHDGKHHRCKDDAAPRRFLPLDLDFIPDGEALADLLLALQPYRHFAYTTASHTPELPRLRVVLELSRPVDRDDGIRIGLAFQAQLAGMPGLADIRFDTSVYRAEQACFGPLTGAEVYPRDRRMTGAMLDVDELLASAPEIPHESNSSERAERIAHDDPKIAYLYEHGFVLEVPKLVGKLAIRCPNAAAHSHETGPTSTVVLLPHFNGVVHAKIKCLHESCASVTQDDFWRLAGCVDPGKRGNGSDAHEDPRGGTAPDEEPKAKTSSLPDVVIDGIFALADAMPELTYVRRPLFIQGQVITLTAHPGHGKSTVSLKEAFDLIELQPEGLAYYVSAEDVEGTKLRAYGEAIRRGYSSDERARVDARLRWVHVNGVIAPSVIKEFIEKDRARSAPEQRVLAVFVDTGPALFSGDDESANVEMQRFAAGCRVLTDLPGRPCVVVFWHPTKSATADNLAPRGGSALLGAVDGNLTLWLDLDSGITTLRHAPSKWRGDHFEPMAFRFEPIDLILPSGTPRTIKLAATTDDRTPAAARKTKPLNAAAKIALDALRATLAAYGERQPTTAAIPPNSKAVTLDQWRSRFYVVVTLDPTEDAKERRQRSEARRQKFLRARDELLAVGICSTVDDYWWLL